MGGLSRTTPSFLFGAGLLVYEKRRSRSYTIASTADIATQRFAMRIVVLLLLLGFTGVGSHIHVVGSPIPTRPAVSLTVNGLIMEHIGRLLIFCRLVQRRTVRLWVKHSC